jgi:hypothetical protein
MHTDRETLSDAMIDGCLIARGARPPTPDHALQACRLAGSQPRGRRHQRSLLKFSPPPNAFLSPFNTTLVTQPKQGGRLDGLTTQTYDIIPTVRGSDTDAVQFSLITLHHPHHPLSSLFARPLFSSSSRPLTLPSPERHISLGLDRIPEQFLAAASRSPKRVRHPRAPNQRTKPITNSLHSV